MQRLSPKAPFTTLGLLMALGLPACGDDSSSTDDGAATGGATSSGDTDSTVDDTGDSSGATASVTFWDDVAPILYQRCTACHRDGSIGPFNLVNYEDAQTWGAAMVAAMEARTMPPWLVTDDGSCGEFRDSRWMPDEEIALISTWVDEGYPEGEPRDDLQVPEFPTLDNPTTFETPNFTPEIQGGELAEFDEYRCFLVDPDLPGDRFMTGYDVLPGNEAIVHHVLVMPVDPDLQVNGTQTNAEVMQALDDESPDRAGWPCFGAAGDGVDNRGIPVSWAPGQGVVNFPEGTGLRIAENEQLVIQVHYNLVDPATHGQSDQSQVQLRLEESVEREGIMLLPDPFLDSIFGDDPITLPPGEESVEYTWEVPALLVLAELGIPQIDLYGVFPHMHEFGTAMRLDINGADDSECAAEVTDWDFGWQLQYFYEEPRVLTAQDSLQVTCEFNTMNATEPVTPGWGTNNEMCLMGVYLVP